MTRKTCKFCRGTHISQVKSCVHLVGASNSDRCTPPVAAGGKTVTGYHRSPTRLPVPVPPHALFSATTTITNPFGHSPLSVPPRAPPQKLLDSRVPHSHGALRLRGVPLLGGRRAGGLRRRRRRKPQGLGQHRLPAQGGGGAPCRTACPESRRPQGILLTCAPLDLPPSFSSSSSQKTANALNLVGFCLCDGVFFPWQTGQSRVPKDVVGEAGAGRSPRDEASSYFSLPVIAVCLVLTAGVALEVARRGRRPPPPLPPQSVPERRYADRRRA